MYAPLVVPTRALCDLQYWRSHAPTRALCHARTRLSSCRRPIFAATISAVALPMPGPDECCAVLDRSTIPWVLVWLHRHSLHGYCPALPSYASRIPHVRNLFPIDGTYAQVHGDRGTRARLGQSPLSTYAMCGTDVLYCGTTTLHGGHQLLSSRTEVYNGGTGVDYGGTEGVYCGTEHWYWTFVLKCGFAVPCSWMQGLSNLVSWMSAGCAIPGKVDTSQLCTKLGPKRRNQNFRQMSTFPHEVFQMFSGLHQREAVP
eukprot:267905-Rhodomonas_salina.3